MIPQPHNYYSIVLFDPLCDGYFDHWSLEWLCQLTYYNLSYNENLKCLYSTQVYKRQNYFKDCKKTCIANTMQDITSTES